MFLRIFGLDSREAAENRSVGTIDDVLFTAGYTSCCAAVRCMKYSSIVSCAPLTRVVNNPFTLALEVGK